MRDNRYALTPYEFEPEGPGIVSRLLVPILLLLGIAGLFFLFWLMMENVSGPLFLGGSGVLLVLLAMLSRLSWGVVIWAGAGAAITIKVISVPGGTTGGSLTPSILILTALLGAWFLQMIMQQRNEIPQTSFNAPFVMFCLWGAMAVVAGNVFWDPMVRVTHRNPIVQSFCASMFFFALGAIWLIGHFAADRKRLPVFFYTIIVVSLWTLVVRYGGFVPVDLRIKFDPLVRTHGCALAVAYFFVAERKKTRMWMAIVAVICLMSVFLEFFNREEGGQWVSGWVALCVPVAVIVFFRSRQIFISLGLIGTMFLVAVAPFIHNMFDVAEKDNNWFRFEIWGRAFAMPFRHGFFPGFFFGVGPGNFWDYQDSFFNKQGLTSAHGQFQQVVAETGYVGLALLAWSIVAIFAYLNRLRLRVHGPMMSSIVLGAMGSFAGLLLASLLGDYLFPVYHNEGYTYFSTTIMTWVMIGGAVAVDQYHQRLRPAEGDDGRRRDSRGRPIPLPGEF